MAVVAFYTCISDESGVNRRNSVVQEGAKDLLSGTVDWAGRIYLIVFKVNLIRGSRVQHV